MSVNAILCLKFHPHLAILQCGSSTAFDLILCAGVSGTAITPPGLGTLRRREADGLPFLPWVNILNDTSNADGGIASLPVLRCVIGMRGGKIVPDAQELIDNPSFKETENMAWFAQTVLSPYQWLPINNTYGDSGKFALASHMSAKESADAFTGGDIQLFRAMIQNFRDQHGLA